MTVVDEHREGFRSNTAEARSQRRAVGAALSRLIVLIEQSERAFWLAHDRLALRLAFAHLREHARASNAAHAEAANADPHPQYQ